MLFSSTDEITPITLGMHEADVKLFIEPMGKMDEAFSFPSSIGDPPFVDFQAVSKIGVGQTGLTRRSCRATE